LDTVRKPHLQRRDRTKSVPPVRFIPRLAPKPALVTLASNNPLRHPLDQLWREQIEQSSNGDDCVSAAHVHLAVVVHAEPAAGHLHAQKPAVQRGAVDDSVGLGVEGRDEKESEAGGVGGCAVGELAADTVSAKQGVNKRDGG